MSLQKKILALVLLPLILLAIALQVVNTQTRVADARETLDTQRKALVEAREQGIKDVVEAAQTSLRHLVEDSRLSQQEAQARASEIIRSLRFDNDNYIFVYDYSGVNVVHPYMPHLEGQDLWNLQGPDGDYLIRGLINSAQSGGDFYRHDWENPATDEVEPKYSYAAAIPEWEWMLGSGIYLNDIDVTMAAAEAQMQHELRRSLIASAALSLLFVGIIIVVVMALLRRALRPIKTAVSAMEDIAQGRGDLTRRLAVESNDEIGSLAIQFNAFVERMQETLRDVRRSTMSVYHSAGEISHSSEELATRTEQAAANLQETSASMEEITSTVNHSADNAQQANKLVQSTSEVAHQGEEAMGQVERTMSDINDSATRISEIISMIDAIAFQTNILALNASVEAARAGEHGRGFAVVAQEVRVLASRSSDASKEIRGLIDNSVQHTHAGAELVRNAGATMREIVESVSKVTDVIGEISAGAKEQSSGIGQINTAVAEMDTMTQQNAAMVQESTTAAADMRRHAEHLNELINSFILGDDEPQQRQALPAKGTASASAGLKRPALSSKPAPAQHADDKWEEF
ncbi:methyl-accepting chemotaxis protein [Halomonas sp. GFAJ-1]|uniref:methyl-accepting chemotaxis protein n=1 Tax=Halomonas sp. GFAJ-1 TaxID=1118153 RepID=UPI001F17B0AD|nr:methyl-accepting chemotaxis protein [Halomonas sp. GFAJ-1]